MGKVVGTAFIFWNRYNWKRDVQNKFIAYSAKVIEQDSKIEDLIDWENKQDTLAWLDSL